MISGPNRGIGLAISTLLRDRGYSLSLGARNHPPEEEAMSVSPGATPVLRCTYDAERPPTAIDWVSRTVEHFGRIDALINNAGISDSASLLSEDEDAFARLWAVNAMGAARLTRLAFPHLQRAENGRVINISSLSGKRLKTSNTAYAMSKFALVALTHSTRQLGWDHGIRATAVCPSFVATDMTKKISSVAQTAMTQPRDLAEIVALLLALPNSASIAEIAVTCQLEDTF